MVCLPDLKQTAGLHSNCQPDHSFPLGFLLQKQRSNECVKVNKNYLTRTVE